MCLPEFRMRTFRAARRCAARRWSWRCSITGSRTCYRAGASTRCAHAAALPRWTGALRLSDPASRRSVVTVVVVVVVVAAAVIELLLTTRFAPLLFTFLVSDLVPDSFAVLVLPRTNVFRVVFP